LAHQKRKQYFKEQPLKTSTPEKVGVSSARLSRIGPVMQRYVDESKLAGILTLIARRGRIVHLEKVGMMDIEANKPMQFDTIFRIYSMTKPITSVAVMMLYEEGCFQLGDPISRFIPDFQDVKVFAGETESGLELTEAEREITIWDLLTHTSGLSYGGAEDSPVDALYRKQIWERLEQKPETTLEDLVNTLTTLPLVHQPGAGWTYSMATDVLGYLVQVVSGMPFDEFLKGRIFEPLGMVDTDFYVPPEKIDRFAANYGPAEDGGLKVIDRPSSSQYAKPTTHPSGGGGLVSTAADYIRFAQMLLNRGEYDSLRLLGRKTIEFMTTNHLADGLHPFEDQAYGFGLGFDVRTSVARSQIMGSVGSFGWGGAANTNFWVDPQEELIGLLMLQFMPSGHYPVTPDFRVLTYQAIID
jgi:CubicO group peptidase (beta-lactamase class C family)